MEFEGVVLWSGCACACALREGSAVEFPAGFEDALDFFEHAGGVVRIIAAEAFDIENGIEGFVRVGEVEDISLFEVSGEAFFLESVMALLDRGWAGINAVGVQAFACDVTDVCTGAAADFENFGFGFVAAVVISGDETDDVFTGVFSPDLVLVNGFPYRIP